MGTSTASKTSAQPAWLSHEHVCGFALAVTSASYGEQQQTVTLVPTQASQFASSLPREASQVAVLSSTGMLPSWELAL
uniref:Uncharacterized protein n=1 Tax=Tetraselmis sp. GSL018 TaxID=582737 RepID=A0A061QX92_9CHLO